MDFSRILIRATNWVGDAVMSLPAFQEWTTAGLAETLVIERFETV